MYKCEESHSISQYICMNVHTILRSIMYPVIKQFSDIVYLGLQLSDDSTENIRAVFSQASRWGWFSRLWWGWSWWQQQRQRQRLCALVGQGPFHGLPLSGNKIMIITHQMDLRVSGPSVEQWGESWKSLKGAHQLLGRNKQVLLCHILRNQKKWIY